jgi:hypothetical protein
MMDMFVALLTDWKVVVGTLVALYFVSVRSLLYKKGKERKGKERKGKERKGLLLLRSIASHRIASIHSISTTTLDKIRSLSFYFIIPLTRLYIYFDFHLFFATHYIHLFTNYTPTNYTTILYIISYRYHTEYRR